MHHGAFASLVVVAAAAMAQTRRLSTPDILKLPSQPPAEKIAYGRGAQQFAELRLPTGGGPFPVVVLVHGGCWIGYADAGYTAHLASALTREGFATWNLEYRRAHEPGGGWPGTFLDVAHGVDALRSSAALHKLDLSRVVLMGHSAGGHLALWSAARPSVPKESEIYTADPLPVRGVVSLGGIADLRAYAEGGLRDCVAGELQVMGGTPAQQPARYAAASPAELLPIAVPQLLVWGEDDNIVPRALFRAYEEKSRATVLNIPHANHHELCSAAEPGWPAIVAALKRLL